MADNWVQVTPKGGAATKDSTKAFVNLEQAIKLEQIGDGATRITFAGGGESLEVFENVQDILEQLDD